MAEWTRSALADFSTAMDFIAEDDPEAARRVAARVYTAVTRLDSFPALGTPGRRSGTRELVLPRIPFVLVYRVAHEQVTILRLLHTARKWPQP